MNFIKKISFLGPMLGLWFGGLRILQINWNGSFAMDDPGLINFLGSNKITLWTKIFDSTSVNRWRPVTGLGYQIAFAISGRNFTHWLLFNFSLLLLTGLILWFILKRISNSFVLANFSLMIFWGQRHISYQLTTATGVVEGLSTLFFVLFLGAIYRTLLSSSPTATKKYFYSSLVIFLILCLTHERFLVLLPLLIILAFHKFVGAQRAGLVLLATLSVLSIPIFKREILDLPLLVGTGSAWELGFTLSSFRNFFAQAIFGLFGFEIGPAYLAGSGALSSGEVGLWASGISFAASSLLYLSIAMRIKVSEIFKFSLSKSFSSARGIALIAGPMSAILLIAISSTTIRLEPRWLVTPMIALLFFAASQLRYEDDVAQIKKQVLRSLLIIGICTTYATSYFAKSMDGIYYRSHQVGVSSLLHSIEAAQKDNKSFGMIPTYFDSDPVTQLPIFQGYWEANRESKMPLLVTPQYFMEQFPNLPVNSEVNVIKITSGLWTTVKVPASTLTVTISP